MFAQRLDELRRIMLKAGAEAFLLPRSDKYLNEDLAPADERLHWLCGFTGSQGLLAVVPDGAALLVDGRYSVQAQRECAGWLEVMELDDDELFAWLEHRLPAGAHLLADAELHSVAQWRTWERLAAERGWHLRASRENPVDACWLDRPEAAASPVFAQALKWSGEPCANKLQRLAALLSDQSCDSLWLPAPDMLAWILNVRANDIAIAPLPFSCGVLYADGALDWFIDERRLALPESWLPESVRVLPPAWTGRLGELLQQRGTRSIWVDEGTCNAATFAMLRSSLGELHLATHPLPLLRACKNEIELAGSHAAHQRDGLALCRFLHDFETRPANYESGDEFTVVDSLDGWRRRDATYRGVSFDTIAACGANGAQPHYLPKAGQAAPLGQGELLLIDSGGQYPEGTTDVTRVVALGSITSRQRRLYTQVLRAHIALACCRFPRGTSGQQLDVVARQVMWQAGLDYAHGTGHGVGSYLHVHEGPHRIAPHASPVALRPGMITSIEPGLYLEGELGIRLENLYEVVECPRYPGFLCFQSLTLAPFEPALIDPGQLSTSDLAWLESYQQEVCRRLVPDLEPEVAAWLRGKIVPTEQSAART